MLRRIRDEYGICSVQQDADAKKLNDKSHKLAAQFVEECVAEGIAPADGVALLYGALAYQLALAGAKALTVKHTVKDLGLRPGKPECVPCGEIEIEE